MRARLRASGSSDSVMMSFDAVAPPPPPCEAQPASASSNTPATPAHASHFLGSHFPGPVDVMTSCLLGPGHLRRHLFQHHGALLGDPLAHTGSILDVAGQLAASGIDIVPT